MNNLKKLINDVRIGCLRIQHLLLKMSAKVQEAVSTWAEDRRRHFDPTNFGPLTNDTQDKAYYYDRLSQAMLQGSQDTHREAERVLTRLREAEGRFVYDVDTGQFVDTLEYVDGIRDYYRETLSNVNLTRAFD